MRLSGLLRSATARERELFRFAHRSGQLEFPSRSLPAARVVNDVVAQLLTLTEVTHASLLDCGDVNEDVLSAIVRLNETEAFLGVKPLYCSMKHKNSHKFISRAFA